MSSILDALKKSEAERQRGTAPTLDTPIVFQRRPAPSRRRPLWLLPMLALAALAVAWYAGLLPWPARSTPSDPAASAGPADTPASTAAAGAGSARVNPDKDPAEAAAPLAAAPVPVEPTPETDAVVANAVPSRGFYGGGTVRAGAAASPPGGVAVDPVPGAEPAVPAAAPIDPALPRFESADPPASPPFAPSADPGADAAAATSLGAGPVSIHDLPFAVRRELPELNVTMHMYSADPRRRFVLLNGVRARDGESLEGGLEVVEIRAADVVLRYQGTEFLLPLRG